MKNSYKKELNSLEIKKNDLLSYIKTILDKYEVRFISRKEFNETYPDYPKKSTISLCNTNERIIYLVEDKYITKKDKSGRIIHELLEAIILDNKLFDGNVLEKEDLRVIRHKDLNGFEKRILKYSKKAK